MDIIEKIQLNSVKITNIFSEAHFICNLYQYIQQIVQKNVYSGM
jgi:hypothetical protein